MPGPPTFTERTLAWLEAHEDDNMPQRVFRYLRARVQSTSIVTNRTAYEWYIGGLVTLTRAYQRAVSKDSYSVKG
jgi:hypothetical protein